MPEAEIAWLLPDGAGGGVGPDGPIVVPGTVPGDRVRFDVERTRGRTTLGTLREIVSPSPDRRAAPCPYTARCGGCDLDMVPPAAQRSAKAGILRHALRLDADPVVVPSPRERGYRARIKLGIQGSTLGFHAPRSHELVPVQRCGIARPELQDALPAVRAALERCGGSGLSEVELRSDGERVVFAFGSNGSVPRSVRESLEALGDVALDGRRICGEPIVHLPVAGHRLRASPRAFYQVNLELNSELVAHVVAQVAQIGPARTLDLYAGIGNFTLPLAHATRAPVLAVELEGQALDDLRDSAERAGLSDRIATLGLPVERLDPSREPFDAVVLDPPRAGAPGVIERLIQNRPRRIVYIACHAPSAARDLRAALRAGYTVQGVTGFDLFPDTHHVETVVVLDRGRPGAQRSNRRRR